MKTSRRRFLFGTAAAAGSAFFPTEEASAIEPIRRKSASHLKLSIAGYSFRKEFKSDPPRMTLLEDFVDFAAEHGLDAIEPTTYYFPEPVTENYLLELKRRAFLSGLDISGTAIGNTYTYAEGPERRRQVELTKTWIDRAAILGAPCIRVFAGNVQEGDDEAAARKHCIETLHECLEHAAGKGVFLALENHGGIVTTAEQLLSIVREVDSPWFGVNLDTGNFRSEDPYREIEMAAPYAVTVQLKVEVRPGGGKKVPADLPRVVRILKDAGYQGYVALEYEAAEEALVAIPKYIEKLKEIL